jgi:hypothetical protein
LRWVGEQTPFSDSCICDLFAFIRTMFYNYRTTKLRQPKTEESY